MSRRLLPRDGLGALFDVLGAEGYRVVGPTVRDGAIVYDRLDGPGDLPVGWTDEQAPGRYRLVRRGDGRAFGYAVGPHSWKRELFPAEERLLEVEDGEEGPRWRRPDADRRPTAFLGVRACELRAMQIQDRVFLGGPYRERAYGDRREDALVIAVDCHEAGELCFCASMDAGPEAGAGFDLRLVELEDGFLVEAGSERGRPLLERLPTRPSSEDHERAAAAGLEACRAGMGRTVEAQGLPGLLVGNVDHPRWDDVASRCLACGNCTLVCPTCFCSTVEDTSDLGGGAGRTRVWDSCFTAGHSSVHGGIFRPSVKDRYRQWLTHKFDTWHAQFGTSGCVGCGRCIAWCPPGIDVTEELAALREDAAPPVDLSAGCVDAGAPGEGDALVPRTVRVAYARRETDDVVTLGLDDPEGLGIRPGQFQMLALPAVGEVPISASAVEGRVVEHTIRAVGAATRALCRLRAGDALGVRGPFGSAWPLEEARGGPLVAVSGGIGLAPLRSALRAALERPDDYAQIRLIHGARTPGEIGFHDELARWREDPRARVSVTVDRPGEGWTGNVGTVLGLLGRKDVPVDGTYLLCGPEVMMVAVVEELTGAGVPPERIWVSMERNMKCAAGFCGRCQYGPWFVCKDGPVFRYDRVAFLFGRRGI